MLVFVSNINIDTTKGVSTLLVTVATVAVVESVHSYYGRSAAS